MGDDVESDRDTLNRAHTGRSVVLVLWTKYTVGRSSNPPPPTHPSNNNDRLRLAGATYATFSVEKAATGLLRILSRLFFRPGLSTPLSPALAWVVPPHCSGRLFESLAGHVSSAMRRLVATVSGGGGGGGAGTGAVGGDEWRAVLSVLGACAGVSGGRAEADAFEAVRLLVHDQDLKVRKGAGPGESGAVGPCGARECSTCSCVVRPSAESPA